MIDDIRRNGGNAATPSDGGVAIGVRHTVPVRRNDPFAGATRPLASVHKAQPVHIPIHVNSPFAPSRPEPKPVTKAAPKAVRPDRPAAASAAPKTVPVNRPAAHSTAKPVRPTYRPDIQPARSIATAVQAVKAPQPTAAKRPAPITVPQQPVSVGQPVTTRPQAAAKMQPIRTATLPQRNSAMAQPQAKPSLQMATTTIAAQQARPENVPKQEPPARATHPTPAIADKPLQAKPSLSLPATAKRRWSFKKTLAFALPVLLILGGLATWYLAYFNNPYVAVSQALNNLLQNREDTANYSLAISTDDSSAKVSGNASYLANGKISADAKIQTTDSSKTTDWGQLSLAGDTDTYYLRFDLSNDSQNALGTSLGAVNGRWIKFKPEDLQSSGNTTGTRLINPSSTSATNSPTNTAANSGTSSSTSAGSASNPTNSSATTSSDNSSSLDSGKNQLTGIMECYQAGNDDLDDKSGRDQLISAMIDTRFLVIQNAGRDADGQAFTITLDSKKLGKFADALIDTNYMRSLSDCLNSKGIDSNLDQVDHNAINEQATTIDNAGIKIKLWTKGFDRKVSRLVVTSNPKQNSTDSVKLSLDLRWQHQIPTIDMPTDAQDYSTFTSQLQASLQQTGLASNSLTDSTTSPANPLNNL